MQTQPGLRLLRESSLPYVIGCDEVGLGALAGPATVGVVVARRDWKPSSLVRDSKKLSRSQRNYLLHNVLQPPNLEEGWVKHVSIEYCSDHHTFLTRVSDAFTDLIQQAKSLYPDSLVVLDGLEGTGIPAGYLTFPKADVHVPAVSAASILAKVSRDNLMISHSSRYKGYDWGRNAGYGTPKHLQYLKSLGPTPLHRGWLRPVQDALLGLHGLNSRPT